MLLSILICHLTNRKLLLDRLLNGLGPQLAKANANGAVCEILIQTDDGEKSTGEKRNILLERSAADFISYVDDDDAVSENYVELILKALESKPDCVSLEGIMYRDHMQPRRFSHSIKHGPVWREETSGQRRYLRPCNHLNTVRRELALQAKFPLVKIGEDKVYSERLFPLLKVESTVEDNLYFYYA